VSKEQHYGKDISLIGHFGITFARFSQFWQQHYKRFPFVRGKGNCNIFELIPSIPPSELCGVYRKDKKFFLPPLPPACLHPAM
jgi:hypothetical protein